VRSGAIGTGKTTVLIIYDGRLPERYRRVLSEKFPRAGLIPFNGPHGSVREKVYGSIFCHPDIYFFQLDNKTLIHAPSVPEEQQRSLKKAGVELIRGEKDPGGEYPGTARYNAVRVGDTVFHNLSCTDPVILDVVRKRGLKLVNVSQGYTRCSILPLGDGAMITADKRIARAARAVGVETLLLSAGSVLLPGEEYGFIGGASGKAPDGTVVMLGGIDTHSEALGIERFFAARGVRYIDMPGMPLYDAGGLIFVGC